MVDYIESIGGGWGGKAITVTCQQSRQLAALYGMDPDQAGSTLDAELTPTFQQ